jgi:hypothetical protein
MEDLSPQQQLQQPPNPVPPLNRARNQPAQQSRHIKSASVGGLALADHQMLIQRLQADIAHGLGNKEDKDSDDLPSPNQMNKSMLEADKCLTRNEFIEIATQIEANKIFQVQFRLISQIMNIITLNGKKLDREYPLPPEVAVWNSQKEDFVVCQDLIAAINLFRQNLNNNVSLVQNEREVQQLINNQLNTRKALGLKSTKFFSLD